MGFASQAVDDQDSLRSICTMGVDVGRGVDEVDASHVVIGDLKNMFISEGTQVLGSEKVLTKVLESRPLSVRVPPSCGIVTLPTALVGTVKVYGFESREV